MRNYFKSVAAVLLAIVLYITASVQIEAEATELSRIDSARYNPMLAQLLMTFSVDVYEEEHIRDSLMNCGFMRIKTRNHEIGYNVKRPTFALGEKITPYGRLIAVVVRGTDSISNWMTNISVGTGEEHEGFACSRDYILEQLALFLAESEYGDLNTTYFITGYSYGGAVANLLAVELSNRADSSVFAYTFASPNVTRDPAAFDSDYDNIFNVCNTLDLVTTLPTHVTGNPWKRYGNDIFFREEAFASSFMTHHRSLYMDVLSRLETPDEHGNMGDISEESVNIKWECYIAAKRPQKRNRFI